MVSISIANRDAAVKNNRSVDSLSESRQQTMRAQGHKASSRIWSFNQRTTPSVPANAAS